MTVEPSWCRDRDGNAFGHPCASYAGTELVDWARGRIEAQGSLDIVGMPGSGRTEFLRQLSRRLREDKREIFAIRGAHGAPLEAIRIALTECGVSEPGDGETRGQVVLDNFYRLLAERDAVILIDDGDALDGGSWSAIEAGHKATGAPIVVTHGFRPGMRSALSEFVSAATAIRMRPLTLISVGDLLEIRHGQPVPLATCSFVYTASGGLPGVALALFDALVEEGMTPDSDPSDPAASRWPRGMIGAFDALLARLPRERREALELISIAGAADVECAERLFGSDVLELLEGESLVRSFNAAGRWLLSAYPPGLREFFAGQPATLRRSRLVRVASEALSCDSSCVLNDSQDEDLAGPLMLLPDIEQTPLVVRYLVEATSAEESDVVSSDLVDDGPSRYPLFRQKVVDRGSLDRLVPLSRARGVTGDSASIALAAGFVVFGRSHDALSVLAEREPECAVLGQQSAYLTGLALFGTERYGDALTHTEAHIGAAIAAADGAAILAHTYVRALVLVALGEFDRAQDDATLAVSTDGDASGYILAPDKALLCLLAAVAVYQGRTATSAALAFRASECGVRTSALPFADSRWVNAVADAAVGETAAAARDFAKMSGDLGSRGFRLAAGFASMLSLSFEFGRGAVDASARACSLGSGLCAAYLAAESALARQEPDGVTDAAERLARIGASNHAKRFLVEARRLYLEREDREGMAATHDQLRSLSGGTFESAPGSLSSRELEVVRLVAAGKSNRRIAEELFLSVRTVETHLRNIRRKSGACSREDVGLLARR